MLVVWRERRKYETQESGPLHGLVQGSRAHFREQSWISRGTFNTGFSLVKFSCVGIGADWVENWI